MASNKGDVRHLMSALKTLLRKSGLPYPEVARRLNVSERTVQRWMTRGGLTLDRVTELCELIGISIYELFELAERSTDKRPRRLTIEQEQGLADRPMLAFLFTRLLQGWAADDLRPALSLTEADLVKHLLALEKLELVELHPGNRIRLLTRRNIDWRPGGPMRSYFDSFARDLMSVTRFGDETSIWTSEAFHLTVAAAAEVGVRLQTLRLDVRQLADSDRRTPPEQKHWYTLLLLAHRHDLTAPSDPLSSAFGLRDATGG